MLLSIIATLSLLIGIGIIILKIENGDIELTFNWKNPVGLFFIAFSFILFLSPIKIIPEGSRGLKFTMGKIHNQMMNPGPALVWPIVQSTEVIDIKPIQINIDVSVGSSGAITKDNQTIGATMVFFYKYKIDNLVLMYRSYGEQKLKDIIVKTALECFKAEIGMYDIFSLAMKQDAIQKSVFAKLKEKLTIYPIEVTELKITNYDWSDDFDRQIAETMQRAQQVKQKEQELLVTEQESQKLVKQAEAEKQALITKAEGEKGAAQLMAEAKALEGEGIRKYNESVQKNMELEIKLRQLEIDRIKAQKWNGQYVPTNNYSPIPIQHGKLLPE